MSWGEPREETMAESDAPYGDFSRMTNDMYKQWETAMTTWWDQVLENPTFLKSMGDNLSAHTRGRRAYEQAVDHGLERAHLPTRADLVRVARIASLLEEKVLAVEDQLLALKDQGTIIEKEALRARIEAAETREMLHEKLATLEAKIDALSAPKAASTRSKKP
jgi:hypothetical protein